MKHRKNIRYIVTIVIIFIVVLTILSVNTSASSGTVIYESEPNDDFGYSNITYDDYDNKGAITSLYDDDFWRVTFDYSGYANFWLGNIPANCNFELAVYTTDSSGNLYLADYGIKTGNSDELVTINVTANKVYYAYIFSANGYSNNQYTFRTKVYPTKLLNVTLHEQDTSVTCSSACAYMTLTYHGVSGVYENDITLHQKQQYGL